VGGTDPWLAALGEQVAKGPVAARRNRYTREVVELIRAVHRLTRRRTYAETTVAEILNEAGLSTRAFYRHFQSKDELLVAVFEYETALVLEQLEDVVAGAEDAGEQFDRWLDWYLELLAEPRRLARFLMLQQEHDRLARDHRDRMGRLDRSRDAVLVAILARGVTDGTFPSAVPAQDAPVVHGLVMAFLRRVATGDDLAADEVRRQVRRFCEPVLGAR
jgi:AcrR family transcriptional regulator